MFLREYIFLIIFFCFLKVSYGQQANLYFKKINTQNGLSHNKVNCIIQDQRGFIWMGTDDGLNRFDGQYFTSFRHQPNNPSTISGNIITDLLEDEQGKIWIATADGGLTKYDHRLKPAEQFKQFTNIPGDTTTIPINIINALIQDKMNHLWLATSGKRVLRFDKKNENFIQPVNTGTSNALALCIDQYDSLWVGRQGGGLLKVNTNNLSYHMDDRYLDLYADLPHVTVTSLYKDRKNNIWFGSWDKVLYCYNPTDQKKMIFKNDNTEFSFPNDEIQAFAEDRNGRIWMGGKYFGLTVYNPQKKHFYNYRHDVAREGTLADNQINCILIDRTGKIWIGTNKGISVYNPMQQPFVQTFVSSKNKNVIIYDFYKDDDQNLWIGTNNGLYIQKKGSADLAHLPLTYKDRQLTISKIFKDDDGTIYLGTDFSLFKFNTSDNSISLLPNTEQDPVVFNIIDSRIISIAKETINGQPVLMVSPYGHFLAYYNLQTKKWVSRNDSTERIIEKFNMVDNLFRKIYKTRSGKIWLATGKAGLGAWINNSTPVINYYNHNPANNQSISNNNIYDVVETKNGDLWISTFGGGLNFFDIKSKKFSHLPNSHNLLEGLQLDEQENVWMISNGNLHQYNVHSKSYSSFTLPDLEKSGGVSGNIYKDDKGRMYLAGTNYFISFHPSEVVVENKQPHVYFTDFKLFNTSHSHLAYKNVIPLKHNQNHFTIEFAAPEFSGNEVEYAYMLEGFDADWILAGKKNYASYSNLQGGNYTFKVKATNKKGYWNQAFTAINININPPFWKRWWFFIALALLTGAGVYGLYRYRINELLERQAIRNKIAQDLHDNVGSTLSSISIYSQVAKIYKSQEKQDDLQDTLEKISSTSSEMISEMNDIVWAINPRNDNMKVILQRMESYARPLLQAKKISFEFNYDPAILHVNMQMEQRKNFYLIFKEAVNNALKYSNCTHLEVNIKSGHGHITLIVKDNGIGFDEKEINTKIASSLAGNGLQNMKRRAFDMKGTIHFTTKPGEGTMILLKFPIT